MRKYIQDTDLTETETTFAMKLDKAVSYCSNFSLYKQAFTTGKITFIGSHACDNRSCFVCNWLRQKRIRRQYIKFFKENEYLFLYQHLVTKNTKVVTESQKKKFEDNEKYSLTGKRQYDLFHLTLTVPHYKETGFRNDHYYYTKLINQFKLLRKEDFWKHWVYGGEFGIETANTQDNGLHIHIHSLVFVRKASGNRNILHREILYWWNRYTVDPNNPRKEFSDWNIESIMKGNKTIDGLFARSLNPQGSTWINLEMIYTTQNGVKCRGTDLNSDAVRKAVLEAISYHFEPQCFDKSNWEINVELLVEVLPHIYKQRLYSRFGCLMGEKSLSANYSDPTQELDDVEELLVDEETGELLEEFKYMVIHPSKVSHIPKNTDEFEIVFNRKAKSEAITIEASSTHQALDKMTDMMLGSVNNAKALAKRAESLSQQKELKIRIRKNIENISEN